MRTLRTLFSFLLVLVMLAPCLGFGRRGHQVVGHIAEHYLSPEARARVVEILGQESLADVSTWADEIRGDRSYRWAKKLHYINVPRNATSVSLTRDCDDDECVVAAITDFTDELVLPDATAEEREEAVRFLVHFVGDVHQPLHVSYRDDLGGNRVNVRFEGASWTLHGVWDTGMVNLRSLGGSKAYADRIRSAITPAELAEWRQSTDPVDWANESLEITRLHAYRFNNNVLDPVYVELNSDRLEKRLAAGGVRLAEALNRAFGSGVGADAVATVQNYYAGVDTTSGMSLRRTLHEIIDDHTRFPYTSTATDTWDIVDRADEDPANPANILDLYRNESFPKAAGGNPNYNREHSWPKSYGFPDNVSSNYPYTDCHHLFVCFDDYNSSRGNKPYMNCAASSDSDCNERVTEETNSAGGDSDENYPGNSNWTKGAHETGAWETWVGRRGDVARALFYLAIRYEGGMHGVTGVLEPDLELTDDVDLIAQSATGDNEPRAFMGYLSTLLEWHGEDPVDDKERRRNDVVFSFQGNRNPFIDHPEWVARIFVDPNAGGGTGGMSVVWINEFHYDDRGQDEDEFVEIAGRAGTDVSGWKIIGYNGNGGGIYGSPISLAGAIPDQSNGFGVISVPFAGLQNGPDAVALVTGNDVVIEFIAYEQTFNATNGPAEGMQPTLLPVTESGSTQEGRSLQRQGQGDAAADFEWKAGPATSGAVNAGQTFN